MGSMLKCWKACVQLLAGAGLIQLMTNQGIITSLCRCNERHSRTGECGRGISAIASGCTEPLSWSEAGLCSMQAVLICGFPGEAFMGDLLRELDHGPAALPGAARAAAPPLISVQ